MNTPVYVWVVEQHLFWGVPTVNRYTFVAKTSKGGINVRLNGMAKFIPKTESRVFCMTEDEMKTVVKELCDKSIAILSDKVTLLQQQAATPRVYVNLAELAKTTGKIKI